MQWYKYDPRLTEITVVNWVVAGTSGILVTAPSLFPSIP
jgi:hypothetical protein